MKFETDRKQELTDITMEGASNARKLLRKET